MIVFLNRGTPNIDPKILYPNKVPLILGNPHIRVTRALNSKLADFLGLLPKPGSYARPLDGVEEAWLWVGISGPWSLQEDHSSPYMTPYRFRVQGCGIVTPI